MADSHLWIFEDSSQSDIKKVMAVERQGDRIERVRFDAALFDVHFNGTEMIVEPRAERRQELTCSYSRRQMLEKAVQFLVHVHDGPHIKQIDEYYRDLGLLSCFIRDQFEE